MNHLELEPEEQEMLREVLQNSVATLDLEIRRTDHAEFRQLLKHRRQVLDGLLVRLQTAASAVQLV